MRKAPFNSVAGLPRWDEGKISEISSWSRVMGKLLSNVLYAGGLNWMDWILDGAKPSPLKKCKKLKILAIFENWEFFFSSF